MKSWNYITKETSSPKGLSNSDTVSFHYFNPNGLYNRFREDRDELWKLVEQGKATTGCLIAYDCAHSYKEMKRLNDLKRVNSIQLSVWTKMFLEDIERLEQFLQTGGNTCK